MERFTHAHSLRADRGFDFERVRDRARGKHGQSSCGRERELSLVLHPAARATLDSAVLRVLLLHGRCVLQHVEHAVVLIRGLRGRLLGWLRFVAGVRLTLRLGRRTVRAGVLLLVLVFVLVLVVVLRFVLVSAVLVLILAGIGLVTGVGLTAVVRSVRWFGVFLLVFLVLDAPQRDRAIVRGVAADAVPASSGTPGIKRSAVSYSLTAAL